MSTPCGTLEFWKDVAAIASSVVTALGFMGGTITLCVGVLTYRRNSRAERAKWAGQLFEKFYEADRYKKIRQKLDCGADDPAVAELVAQEGSGFTDYLNFFELVTFLARSEQLSRSDVLSLFKYYLDCLRQHPTVMKYVRDKSKGFEQLRDFLNETEPDSAP
ncbi:MAG TPA: hypothetical protein VK670_01815 [Silvibacterium sp.]|nr:hypothetical protein [Silvibacterium sp.]